MKNFIIILGLLLLSLSASAERACKEKYRTFAEQIARLDPSADLDIVDLNLFPGGGFVAGYEYEVQPAYTKGLYTRTDRWLVSGKAIPSTGIDLGQGYDFDLSAGVRGQTEATFIRFMNDPCSAMLADPYSPRRIPLKAEVALGPKFNKGDYFLFRGSVGFVASADILNVLGSGMWGVGLSGHYLMEGFYQLHIVRLDETHIRLKVVGHRGKTAGTTLGFGYEKNFDVFSVRALDRGLERFVNTKPVKIEAHVGKSKVFLVDYVLDLSDKDVAYAFEKVLKKVKNFQNIHLAGPFKNDKDLEAGLLLDLSPLEDLYKDDFNAGREDRIKRNLRSNSEQTNYRAGVKLGNKIIGYKAHAGGSTVHMSINTPSDEVERYLLKTWEKERETRFFYSWSKNRTENSLHALFSADESFGNIVPINVVQNMRQKKNRYSYNDFQKLRMKLKKALPRVIFDNVPWENWQQGRDDKFFNFGLRFELLMSPESILEAPELSVSEIKALYKDYLLGQGLTAEDFFMGSSEYPDEFITPENNLNRSLNKISRYLSQALDKDLPMTERLEKITKLKLDTVFAESGLGFLMVLRPDKMRHYYHLDLDISSNEAIIDYSYGDSEMSELYKKILTIKAALDDDGLDLLREAESLSVKQVSLSGHAE